MKAIFFSFFLLASNVFVYSQAKTTKNYEQVKINISKINESILEEMYFNTYEIIENTLPIVEDKKQLNTLIKMIKKLKKKCPSKPSSICDCIEAKMKKGEKISEELLFWYNCKELLEKNLK